MSHEAGIDLRPFLSAASASIEAHAMDAPGAFRRFTRDVGPEGARTLAIDPYGCADAANLLYTLGRLPREPVARNAVVERLRSLQDAHTGLFAEATHHPLHTTAHCLAALELFDAQALHRPRFGREARPDGVEPFLEALDWAGNAWIASHRGAGLYVALLLSDQLVPEWADRYFDWIDAATDPRTGLIGGRQLAAGAAGDPMRFPMLAGTFHDMFDQQHARRAHAHPETLIDTCLGIRARALFPLCSYVGFAEVDWVYCLHRAVRQCGHRFAEAQTALLAFAAEYVAFLDGLDFARDPHADDLHALFDAVCALAELQSALPGRFRSDVSLRLVLDRRPFI